MTGLVDDVCRLCGEHLKGSNPDGVCDECYEARVDLLRDLE